MTDPQTDGPDRAEGTAAPRRRLVVSGAGVLLGCAAIIAAAVWVLVRPGLPTVEITDPDATSTPTQSTAPEQDGHDHHDGNDEHGVGHEHDGPHRHGPGQVVGEPAGHAPAVADVQTAEQWVRVLLGWTPQERDATAALDRARDAAPGLHLEHLAGAVLDHAAALATGAGHGNVVEVLEITDPAIWPSGWVVLDAAVVTAGDDGAGVPPVVLHVTCEVQVVDGQVVAAVIGDGAAWIESP